MLHHLLLRLSCSLMLGLLLSAGHSNAQTYCYPSYGAGCVASSTYPGGHWITQVSLGSINHNPANSTCTVSDYTAMSTTVTAGTSTPMSVTTSGYVGVAVRIDFNQDGDFDELGETLYTNYIASAAATYNFNLLIPANTAAGSYRMRVMNWDGNAGTGGGCSVYNWGNFYDYTITIQALCATVTGIAASPALLCTSGTSDLSLSYTSTLPVTVKWYDALGNLIGTGSPFTTPTISNTTTYYAAADNGLCDTPRTAVTVKVIPPVLPPLSVTPEDTVICEGKTVAISVTKVTQPDSVIALNGSYTTSRLPLNGASTNSASELIYTASELGIAGKITHIGFYKKNSNTTFNPGNVSIYMKTTAVNTVGATASTAGYTLVYSGPWDNAGVLINTWNNIVLDNAYDYDGSGNLAVLVIRTAAASSLGNAPVYRASSTAATYRSAYYIAGAWMSGVSPMTPDTLRPDIKIGYTVNPDLNWTPVTSLYKDMALTQPMTALQDTNTVVYAQPAANITYNIYSKREGCLSTGFLTAEITVADTFLLTVADTICDGDTYVFGAQNLTGSGQYTHTFSSVSDCDSTVIVDLFVKPAVVPSFSAIAPFCSGSPPPVLPGTSVNGITGTWTPAVVSNTVSGTYTFIPDPGQCADTVTMAVTVNSNVSSTDNQTICAAQQPYTWNGIANAVSGSTYTTTGANGCDSMVTLSLIVNPYLQGNSTVTICQGDSYVYNGITYTTAQTGLLDTFTTLGCDSIHSLDILVSPYLQGASTVTICQGDSYTYNGITYTTAQVSLLDTFTTAGCDSIHSLDIIVSPYQQGSSTVTICQGDSYTYNGITYTTAQTGLLDTFITAGCDSIHSLDIIVSPYQQGSSTVTICQGDSYTYNGITYTTAQTGLLDTFATAGCDSIHALDIIVNPYLQGSSTVTICQGQSYTYNGITYTTAQSGLLDTFVTAGCDSIHSLDIIVSPYQQGNSTVTICQGDSYVYNGITYTTAQTGLLDTFTTAGCDSIHTLDIIVSPYLQGASTVTICQGQSYIYNGITYTTAQSGLLDTFSTAACDSIHSLDILISPYLQGASTVTICQGQSYIYNGITYTTAQTGLLDTFATAGCDSIHSLDIIVSPYQQGSSTVTICQGDSYTYNGITYTTAQTGLLDTFATSGCDSIHSLDILVNPYLQGNSAVTICQGDSYTYNGITYTTSQTGLLDTFTTSGCDSIHSLDILVNPYLQGNSTVTICQGQSYIYNGITYTTAQSGLLDTFSTAGCDSIHSLDILVSPYLQGASTVTICQGQSYIYNGITYTTAQSGLLDTFTTSGCDSIHSLDIIVSPYLQGNSTVTICQGDSYAYNGITYTTPQSGLLDTFTTAGCDSIHTLDIIVSPYLQGSSTVTICQGDSYTYNGITYTTAQTGLLDTFATSGCDSIHSLDILVNPYLQGFDTVLLCYGQTYSFNGTLYNTSQSGLKDTVSTLSGCDSIITLNLIVLPAPEVRQLDTAACGSLFYQGRTYLQSTVVLDTLTNSLGCDSVLLTTNIIIYPNNPYTVIIDTAGCFEVWFEGRRYKESIMLEDTLYSVRGCDSVRRLVRIEVETFELTLTADPQEPYQGERVHLVTSANTPAYTMIAWSPAAWFPDQYNKEQYHTAQEAGTIVVTGRSDRGCEDTASISLAPKLLNYGVFVPNAFSPNGDGLNDQFTPRFYMDRAYVIRNFRVFNRWGQLVFSKANVSEGAWDGNMMNGVPADVGTYHYFLEVRFADGKERRFKGDITLVR